MKGTLVRRLIVTNIVPLDGYYEGPGRDVMALPMDHVFDAYNAERMAATDTLLYGRKTYEGFRGFWPKMASTPTPHPLIARSRGSTMSSRRLSSPTL